MGIKTFFDRLFGKVNSDSVESVSGATQKSQNGDGATLVCVDCKQSFIFESGEQKFFKMRGLTPPKRCSNCRAKRKQRK